MSPIINRLTETFYEIKYPRDIGYVHGNPALASTTAIISSQTRLQRAKKTARKWVASKRAATIRQKAAVFGGCESSDESTSTLCDSESPSGWDDSAKWGEQPTWDDSTAWSSSSAWDDSCSHSTTPGTPTPATTTCDEEPTIPTAINGITIESPFLASFLGTIRPLDVAPATKQQLATYLKRTVEASCSSFITKHASAVLDYLRLESYDTIDMNVWITLIDHLRSTSQLPGSAFATCEGKEVALPNMRKPCGEKPSKSDTNYRLRQVAIHRWDYDTHLLWNVVGFLALLKDHESLAEVEGVLQRLHEYGTDAMPSFLCSTKNGFLGTIANVLERTLYTCAQEHCPNVLTAQGIQHAHAMELNNLSKEVTGALASHFSLEPTQTKAINEICQAIRNVAAHHNSFTPEAILGRAEGGTVWCRYDTADDPYTAIAKDAERVVLLLGDEDAARQVRLALWVADKSTSSIATKRETEDLKARDNLALARKAQIAKPSLSNEDKQWEAARALHTSFCEATASFERRAAEVVGVEAWAMFERWRCCEVGRIEDPRIGKASDLVWVE